MERIFNKGESMKENIFDREDLKKVVEELKEGDGYLLGLAIFKKGKLYFYLHTNNFPKVDMLPSLTAIEKLVVKDLKRTPNGDLSQDISF